MKEYYAHSPKDEKGIPAQTYAAHVNNVVRRANEYAAEAGAYCALDGALLCAYANQSAVYHDLGKLDEANQEVLSGKKKSKSLPKNHVDAGAAHFLQDTSSNDVPACAIYAHHIGLPDFPDEENKEERAFRDLELSADTNSRLHAFEQIHHRLIENTVEPEAVIPAGDHAVFFRMLLSCLADADHTDTAINEKNYPANEERIYLRAKERLTALDNYVSQLNDSSGRNPENERNILRDAMYYACRDVDVNSDIASCDSPVGSGKTTAVMAHLLAQANKRGLRRIFVVLPFTNIIKQSVDTYRKALALPGENPEDVVAELHHLADFESENARHLTALWRAPIVVTTAVAFFETLSSNRPAALRRLHELPGSAIFVDESHAVLPAKLLPLAWRWMNVLAREWGCYWVLASGSLNRFWSIPEIAQEYKDEIIPEIVESSLREKLSDYENWRIAYKADLLPKTLPELATWIVSFQGPRLVILNTVQGAAVLADAFRQTNGRGKVEHLSTALTPLDREATLNRVKARLDNPSDTDWTLIATTCVEAGVNLSFHNGFHELCPLVSLLQAAGRVNREGRYADSEMWAFEIAYDDLLRENPGMRDGAEVLRSYLKNGAAIASNLSTESTALEIRLHGTSGFDKLLKHERERCFKTIGKGFKVIDADTEIVVVNKDMADRIRYGSINWKDLQRNSVQINRWLLDTHHTPKILDNIYHWNLLYDDFIGYMAGVVQMKKFEGQAMIV